MWNGKICHQFIFEYLIRFTWLLFNTHYYKCFPTRLFLYHNARVNVGGNLGVVGTLLYIILNSELSMGNVHWFIIWTAIDFNPQIGDINHFMNLHITLGMRRWIMASRQTDKKTKRRSRKWIRKAQRLTSLPNVSKWRLCEPRSAVPPKRHLSFHVWTWKENVYGLYDYHWIKRFVRYHK